MPPNPLTNCEIQKSYESEPEFNGVYSKNNLSKIKDGAYIKNLSEYESIGPHWIATLIASDVKHIPREIMKFIGNKNVVTNIYEYKQTIQ